MRQLIDKISFVYGLIALSILWLVLAFFMGDETLDAPSIVSSPVPDFSSYKNVKEKIRFLRGAQIGKSSPRGAQLRNPFL